MGKIGVEKGRLSRRQVAVLALCLVVVNAAFLVFAVSGVINYFIAFGISIIFALCAFALLVVVARSRRQA